MSDAKISQLPINSILGSDLVPFSKMSSSVTSGIAFVNLSATINTSPVITGHASIEGVGLQGVTGSTLLVLRDSPTLSFPSILGNLEAAGTMTIASVIVSVGKVGSGIGYGTGAGSIVTQQNIPLGKQQSVICNAPTGQITIASTLMGASTIAIFTLANSVLGSSDVLLINHKAGGTIGGYAFNGAVSVAGVANIAITNLKNAGVTEAPVIQFAIIKGVNS